MPTSAAAENSFWATSRRKPRSGLAGNATAAAAVAVSDSLPPPGQAEDQHASPVTLAELRQILGALESYARFFAHAKAAVYASAGIGEHWIVNLGERTVEVYLSPDGDRYAEVRTLRAGDAGQRDRHSATPRTRRLLR